MKKKIRVLTTGCVLISLALLVAQFFFLYNTYLLYQKQTLSEIRSELVIIEKKLNIDSLRSERVDRIQKLLLSGTKVDIEEQLNRPYDSFISEHLSRLIDSNNLLKKHRVKYVSTIQQTVIKNEMEAGQPIFNNNKLWFGNSLELSHQNFLTEYTLTRTLKNSNGAPVFCELQTASSFDVGSWQSLLLNKLIGLILFSSLLILSVIALFYISIRNILMQKRIADIKTDFVNNITHEFNTPLATLNIATATLKKLQNSLSSETANVVSTIERQSKKLNSLIKQAVEFSKSGKEIDIQTLPSNISELLNHIVSDFRQINPSIKINLSQNANIIVNIDSIMLATAINNLLDNAVKYGAKKLVIDFSSTEAHCIISIKDDGVGIPLDKQKIIFEKFYRVHEGDTYHTKGLGLGLYYAQQILKAHGGKIEVQSKPRNGSVFSIQIPAK